MSDVTHAQRVSALLAEAQKWVGVREQGGDNCGPEIEAFQRSIGGKACRQAWCAAFVQFCLQAIGGSDIYPSELCLEIWNKSPLELRLQKPEPGCLVIWKHKGTSAGHIGIVKAVLSDTQIHTIEGNTSPASIVDRQGDGVYEKHRAITPVTGTMQRVGFLRCWR